MTNNIKSGSDTSQQQQKDARDYAIKVEHGFPQSRLDLLNRNIVMMQKAKDHLNNLFLDYLKKTKEIETREGLATARGRQAEVDMEVDNIVDWTPSTNQIVHIYILNLNVTALKGLGSKNS